MWVVSGGPETDSLLLRDPAQCDRGGAEEGMHFSEELEWLDYASGSE